MNTTLNVQPVVEVVQVYKTTDGATFEDKLKAIDHQQMLNISSLLAKTHSISWHDTSPREVAEYIHEEGYCLVKSQDMVNVVRWMCDPIIAKRIAELEE